MKSLGHYGVDPNSVRSIFRLLPTISGKSSCDAKTRMSLRTSRLHERKSATVNITKTFEIEVLPFSHLPILEISVHDWKHCSWSGFGWGGGGGAIIQSQ